MNDNLYRILVVDDEEDILEFLSYNLRKEGYSVMVARNAEEAISSAGRFNPHLILLDIMLPDMDGIETCEELRAIPELSDTFIAFLTARPEDFTQIAGFNAGGDDFITKPVRPKVLLSRIKALLRRYLSSRQVKTNNPESKNMADINIDVEKHLVVLNGNAIDLPRKEFNLLCLLTSKPARVFTREEIFSHIWGEDVLVNDRTIDVYIRKLRKKIGQERIKTIKGVGYKFDV